MKAISILTWVAIAGSVALLGGLSQGYSQSAASDELVPVIVGFRDTPGPGDEAALRALGGQVRHRHRLVPAVSGKLSKKAIEALRKNPAITVIEPDIEVHAHADEYASVWGVVKIGAQTVHQGGNTGANINVCVIDSGIDTNHPEFTGIYKGGYDFVNGDADPSDDNGHGTHVAGTVAAALNGSGVVGVAPGVNLYAYKILNKNGSGFFSDVIQALDACAALDGFKITNNSYGSSGDPGTLVKQAFDSAYAKGVLHVASAGNSGNSKGTGDNVGYPARYDSVIAVAATNTGNTRASWSSTGPAVELSAPGVSIYSTYPDDAYATLSGTSMASPHVAGAAALVAYCQAGADNAAVRLRMQQTVQDLGAPGRDALYGFGLVRPDLACVSVPVGPPAAPSNLRVTATDRDSISLAWNDNSSDETGFELQRCTASCVTIPLGVNTTAYIDTGLARKTTYSYQIRAVNGSGASGWAGPVAGKTK